MLIARPPRVGYPKPGCTIYTSFRGVLVSVFFTWFAIVRQSASREVLLRMAQKKQKAINKYKRPLLELEIKCNCKEVSPLASALTPKLRRTQPYPTAHGPRPALRDPMRLLAPPEQHSEKGITLKYFGCGSPRGLCP